MPSDQPAPDQRIRRALELLSEAARERLRRHPQGHLAAGVRETLAIDLPLPLAADGAAAERAARSVEEAVSRGVEGLLHHRSAFRPGRVWCLRCESAECDHAALPSPRATFAGYGPSGVPRFVDFAQWLVERRDPRAGDLYSSAAGKTLAIPVEGTELTSELLDVYRDRTAGYRLHGQVSAGFYQVPDRLGHRSPIAVTFQVVSSRPEGNPRRYGLNLLVLGPGGEAPEDLFHRLGDIPWSTEVRWAADVVSSIERAVARSGIKRRGKKAKGAEGKAERRIEGLLEGLARRLEKGRRARQRRTRHAEERHGQGDRPTRMALADLARAKQEEVLLDTRRSTFIVLGERGRTHVFNRQGKLVTSIRYPPETIDKRRERGRWKPLPADEVRALRVMVEGEQAGEPETSEAGAAAASG